MSPFLSEGFSDGVKRIFLRNLLRGVRVQSESNPIDYSQQSANGDILLLLLGRVWAKYRGKLGFSAIASPAFHSPLVH